MNKPQLQLTQWLDLQYCTTSSLQYCFINHRALNIVMIRCNSKEWCRLSVQITLRQCSIDHCFSFLPYPPFPSSSFPSLHHHLSPSILHCLLRAVCLPSLSPPLQHIIPLTSRFDPSHSYPFSSLFILALSLSAAPHLAILAHIPPIYQSPPSSIHLSSSTSRSHTLFTRPPL